MKFSTWTGVEVSMILRTDTTASAAATTNVSPVPKRLRLIKRTEGRLSNSAFDSVVFSRKAQRATKEIITITASKHMFKYDGRSLRTVNYAMGYSQMEGHGIFDLPLGEPGPTKDFEKEDERRGLFRLLCIGKF